METHDELVYQVKLERLRAKLAEGGRDTEAGRYTQLDREAIGSFFENLKNEALSRRRAGSSGAGPLPGRPP